MSVWEPPRCVHGRIVLGLGESSTALTEDEARNIHATLGALLDSRETP